MLCRPLYDIYNYIIASFLCIKSGVRISMCFFIRG